IVWPETAAPLLLRHDPVRLAYVRALAQSLGRPVLVGAPDRAAGEPIRLQNSAMLFGPDGRLLAKYDKMHLVPFGEYVPLKPLLFFVDKVATGIGDFVPGETRTIFRVPGGTFAASICFEVIFPAEVRAAVAGGAEFLVNITNDAWFGRSAAPAQHLRMAAFRALETRRYLARAANTGISAAVDPYGRVLRSTGLFSRRTCGSGIGLPRRPAWRQPGGCSARGLRSDGQPGGERRDGGPRHPAEGRGPAGEARGSAGLPLTCRGSRRGREPSRSRARHPTSGRIPRPRSAS
ncbi:MAG: apolipoprotein N-acyltransferase, partial [candidate division NC10 bacterium]|nr:apolipoprotein N-acyltransferase [candidate division NC10 bacterium]